MKPLYKKLGGKSRRVIDLTTGEELSRYQYEKRRRSWVPSKSGKTASNLFTGKRAPIASVEREKPTPIILSPAQERARLERQEAYNDLVLRTQHWYAKRNIHRSKRSIMSDPDFMLGVKLSRSKDVHKARRSLELLHWVNIQEFVNEFGSGAIKAGDDDYDEELDEDEAA